MEYTIESVKGDGENDDPAEDALLFRMDSKTGVLSTRSQLDREKTSKYTIIVCATDQSSPVSDRRTAR